MSNIPQLIEIALLLLVVFLAGCVGGYLLHSAIRFFPKPARMMSRPPAVVPDGRSQVLAEPRDGKKDNLKQIRGIGPGIEKKLNGLGVFHLNQIAAWDSEAVEWIERQLSLKGRVERDKWIEQARNLKG